MRSLSVACLLVACLAAGSAVAQEKPGLPGVTLVTTPAPAFAPSTLALGGVAQRLVVQDKGGFSLGFAPVDVPAYRSLDDSQKGLRLGGFLAWNGGDYRLDATVRPLGFSGFAAGIGATGGAQPGELGTSYGIHLDTGLGGERFSINPASRFGVSGVGGNGDADLVVTVNHAFTPNLSVVGTAEARQTPVGPAESTTQREVLFGAGLGIRF